MNYAAMVNIQEIQDSELLARIFDYQRKGGALRICVFKISENYLGELPNEYLAHLTTARQTLEKQNYEWNIHLNKVARQGQHNYKIATTDYEKLDTSGQKIDLPHFLGPYFDIENNKPIIRGKLSSDTLNSYFYYDQEEKPENKLDINKIVADFRKLYPEPKGCFIHPLMEPPYRMSLGKDILKHGEYILDFLDYFFGDIRTIIIYSWSTDCSVVFDAGKEWWGSYFWTIYSPTNRNYIGMLASETD